MVQKPGLQCHRISRPFNVSCVTAHKGHVLAENVTGKEEIVEPIKQSTDGIGEMIKLSEKTTSN